MVEGKAMPDHIHMCLSIPPKFSVSHTISFLKWKSAVRIHLDLLHERRMTGLHYWPTGYCVSTVGLDEERIRQYIREQEKLETGQGDLNLKEDKPLTAPTGPSPTFTAPSRGAFLRPHHMAWLMIRRQMKEIFMATKNKDSAKRDLHTNVKETLRKIDSPPSKAEKKCEGNRKLRRQVPMDLVEEASMESFPASDAPGHPRSNTGRGEPRRPEDGDVG